MEWPSNKAHGGDLQALTTMSILNFVWRPFLDFGSEKPLFQQSRRQNPTKLACTNINGELLGALELWKRGQYPGLIRFTKDPGSGIVFLSLLPICQAFLLLKIKC